MAYKPSYHIPLGLAPTRRDGFPSPKDAFENKKRVLPKLREILAGIPDVEVVDIEWLNDEGLLVDPMDVPRVAEYFKSRKVDAVFMPHCNYGSEEVVGMLGKAMEKPFLLWGPRDEAPPSGCVNRYTDTQCGLFGSSAALIRYGVPFTYIENCWADSPILQKGIEDFIRVASVVKTFRNLRIGQICQRPKPFLCVMHNESELLTRFGIELVPISGREYDETARSILKDRPEEVAAVVRRIRSENDCTAMTQEKLEAIAALELSFLRLAEKYGCTAMTSECWETFRDFGIEPCSAFGDLNDCGLPTACEADVHGAVSLALAMAAARGETPGFLADLTNRHPENDNAELLWHCGPFPRSLAKEGSKPSIIRCQSQFEIKGGDITLTRFSSLTGGEYRLFADQVKGVEGPPTKGNYVWVETENWPRWERKLIYGPYVHHIIGIHGKYAAVLQEACRYIHGLTPDSVTEQAD